MKTYTDRTQRDTRQQAVQTSAPPQHADTPAVQFADYRPETLEQAELQEMADNSPQVLQLQAYQNLANPQEANAGAFQQKENNTGLPDRLKAGIEGLSGYAMDDVRVHYNSEKPAQLQAHAYAQGSEIHIGPGQEEHLPHEAWHVVQQMQGRVQLVMKTKGVDINDDEGLEHEADLMGTKDLQRRSVELAATRAATQITTTTQRKGETMDALGVSGATIRTFKEKAPLNLLPSITPELSDVVQLNEKLEEKIKRILGNRDIEIDDDKAVYYANELTRNPENTLIPVRGHHRALKINRAGVVSSVQWRPPSNASGMRISPVYGPTPEEESSMLTYGPRPLAGAIVSHDVTISAASLQDIPPRSSLGQVMGGSARQLSGIENSEWLHVIAHSLGGPDAPSNVVAGPHSLNTAMIPFEVLVRSAARQGKLVDYQVTFFSDFPGDDENGILYVHHVEISITLPGLFGPRKQAWTLEVNQYNVGEFINGQVYNEIKTAVQGFAGQ